MTEEKNVYPANGFNYYACAWNGDRDGLTYGLIRKTMYARTKTEAAALLIDDIYRSYGVGMGPIMLHEIIVTEPTGWVTGGTIEELERNIEDLKRAASDEQAEKETEDEEPEGDYISITVVRVARPLLNIFLSSGETGNSKAFEHVVDAAMRQLGALRKHVEYTLNVAPLSPEAAERMRESFNRLGREGIR